ncbi:hypothetical protein Ancab_024547 [Ancistrocladus abbreviatus]
MFYSQFILAKKGPLGTIWIAAHLERKLRKNQVADTDIGVSVDSILFPDVPIALRLSSHLLLGVVRIYSRKVNYLFDDCSEALLKIKQAFRSTAVDLPPEESTAPYHSITLPETFDLDDFELPDNDIIQGKDADHHVSTREQITLQDNMDGVVYSTLPFGLDERFGDGDMSQGLDLDEELLLEKAATSKFSEVLLDSFIDPQATVETFSLHRGHDSDVELSETSKAMPTHSFSIQEKESMLMLLGFQAPPTPGLLEEPNLTTQEAQVSDNHVDEYHNPTELIAKEISGAACSEPEVCHVDNDTVLPPVENGCLLDDREVEKATSQGDPTLEVDPLELILPSYSQSSSVSDGPGKMENRWNGIPIESQPNLASAFQSRAELGDVQDIGKDGHTAVLSHVHEAASVLELPGSDPCAKFSEKSQANSFCSLASNCISENDKSSSEPGVLKPLEGDSRLQVNSSKLVITDSSACRKPQQTEILNPDAYGKTLWPFVPVLQACSSHLDYANAGFDSSVSAPNLYTGKMGFLSSGASASEDTAETSGASTIVQDKSNSDGQTDSIRPRDAQLEKEDGAAASDLPSPEKLLSLSCALAGQPNDLLAYSTPALEVLAEGNGDSVVNQMSGRKRSFAESTLTLQSISSPESFAATQSKKSAEFIPNDDDLLSSILVGRQSTVLKVKHTPPIPDIVCTKRRRVAPRPSPLKRKVLIDDMTVLHGDTIRQHLVNTEDIRRVRKKAPCTQTEIWMLQKQFLEDEIFTDPVFSGMSKELISLHGQPFDMSRTRVLQDERSTAYSMAANEVESCMRPGLIEEPGVEGNGVPSISRNDVDRLSAEALDETPNQQIVKPSLGLDDNFSEKDMTIIDSEPGLRHGCSEDNNLEETTEIEYDGKMNPVEAVADHAVHLGAKLSSFGPVSLENVVLTDGAIIQSGCFNRTDGADDALKIEVPCQSLHQQLDLQSAGEDAPFRLDAPMVGISGGVAVDTSTTEEPDEIQLELRSQDGQFLDQMEGIDSSVARTGTNVDCSSHVDGTNSLAAMSAEGGIIATYRVFLEGRANESEIANNNVVLGSDMQYDDGRTVGYDSGNLKLDSSFEGDVDVTNAILAEMENQDCQEADPQIIMDPTTVACSHGISEAHGQGFTTERFEHDTDFLNFDDDDIAEEDDSCMPNAEEGCILDNSGWSARSRAVANYLQVLFLKEAEHGRKALHLDNLLAGKSRKEASRMFFETLVLKTRDYVHAEQEEPFDVQMMQETST